MSARPREPAFRALEYRSDDTFAEVDYRFEGSCSEGWCVLRDGVPALELGPGYRALRVEACGICSTDLDRRFLPFPLPQIIGHELVALDDEGRRVAVEINASHAALGRGGDCAFCRAGLATHCPDRRVLGIHDLPGGFGPWILAPSRAVSELPEEIPHDAALLIEPFAACLNAVLTVAPRSGDRVAVLGPRRLGLLAIAALASHRRRSGLDFEILAVSRHASLLELARRLGATGAVHARCEGEGLEDGLADVVIDTTGSPDGLTLAVRLARREVHLKSTHGRPAAGLAHPTELVVDELALGPLPEDEARGLAWIEALGLPGVRVRVAWLAAGEPPGWLRRRAEILSGDDAGELARRLVRETPASGLPRADVAVVGEAAQVDRAIRPVDGSEQSLVRPRGEIALAGPADAHESVLLRAIAGRGLRLSSSRCGSFAEAIALLRDDGALQRLGELLITHRFAPTEMGQAFETARSAGCIKAVVEHGAPL